MKRKVIQLSTSTLVVSLPTGWVDKNKILKGSEVDVIEKGEKLVVLSGDEKPEERQTILDTKGRVFDKRYLGDLYIKGYDEIKINFEYSSVMEEVRKINLLGFEVVEEDETHCVIKSVSEAKEDEFDTMLRKCFLLAKEMGKEINNYLNGEEVDLTELRKLEKENNKASVFCLRLLNRNGYSDNKKTTFLYVIARELESICDVFKYIIDDMMEETKEAKQYYSEGFELLQRLYDIYYKYDEKEFREFYDQIGTLIEKGKRLVKEKGILAHHTLNLVIAIRNIYGPYLTMEFE